MSAAVTPKVLEIIRTAAADCDVQGNTMARNELLDAAAMARDLLAALSDIVEGTPLDRYNRNDDGLQDHGGGHNFQKRIEAARAAIAKATGQQGGDK